MRDIYRELFSTYGHSIMQDAEIYDEDKIVQQLLEFRLSTLERFNLEKLMFKYYTDWSTAAFSIGLHLGLTMLSDQVSRPSAQKGQQVSGV